MLSGIDGNRFREALYEAELALTFLENGLLRNAAGKAYQAVEAYVAGLAVDYRERLKPYYPGRRRIGLIRYVERVDWILATVPSTG